VALKDQIISKVSPKPVEQAYVRKVTDKAVKLVTEQANKTHSGLTVMVVGSVAKDTYVYPPDIDIFILFPKETRREDLAKEGLQIGRAVVKDAEERYAEHPYVHGRIDGLEVDIVPCFKVDSPAGLKSAVDRTPFHTRFVLQNISENQRNEVRILKQFLTGVGIYGAEARVQGFSGYLVELLILRYGSFEDVMLAAQNWRRGTTLWLGEKKGKNEFDTPLVFYDPVDENRNVASALSEDSFAMFLRACDDYLASPKESFFFPCAAEIWSVKTIRAELNERGSRLLVFSLNRPEMTEDNLYPQLRRTLDGVRRLLESWSFAVVDGAYSIKDKEVIFAFELLNDELPKMRLHKGPPVWTENAQRFLEKWKDRSYGEVFIENGCWVAKVPRTHRTAKELIEKEIRGAALGSDLRSLSGLKIRNHREAMRAELKADLTALLDKTPPWKR
jgi:tRNA nucleotidyltransferase (CCA-adding enzyme)